MTAAHHCAALGLKKAPAKLIESGADMRRPNVFGDVPEGLRYLPQRAPSSKMALLRAACSPLHAAPRSCRCPLPCCLALPSRLLTAPQHLAQLIEAIKEPL